MSIAHISRIALTILIAACFTPPTLAQPQPTTAAQLQASAENAFREGRLPEAYGRFIALADTGHAPAAEVALFMYANGPSLFGKDWDVSQEQLTHWSRLVGRAAPMQQARIYTRQSVAVKYSPR